MSNILIIGSGLAGYTTARELRNLSPATMITLITEDDGCFYSKPMLSNALAHKRSPEMLVMKSTETMAEQLNLTIHAHCQVTAINPEQQQVQCINLANNATDHGQFSLHYDKLVMALGGKVNKLPFTSKTVDSLTTVNNLTDYRHFHTEIQQKKSIAIFGAGLIGCEFANDLLSTDLDIHVIAPETAPLSELLPPEISHELMNALEEKGVTWHLSVLAQTIERNNNGYLIHLNNGNTLEVDTILSAIGLKASIKLATKTGLDVNKGIQVNGYLETNLANIYAIGDCAEVEGQLLQYITPIMRCARALAKTLNGERTAVHYPPMPVLVKTPACPLVFLPRPANMNGEWQLIAKENQNIKMLFHDAHGKLQAFALTGNYTKEQMSLCKQIK